MDQAENLRTLSEVAVAFAGFTGVVAVLGRRSARPWSFAEFNTIRTLLHTSVGVTLFAFLPSIAAPYVETADTLWRGSAALFTGYHVAIIVSSVRRGNDGLCMRPWVVRACAGSGATSIAATAFVAVGGAPQFAELIYTLAMVQLIAVSAACFGGLLLRGSASA